jgi:hypothetical protein
MLHTSNYVLGMDRSHMIYHFKRGNIQLKVGLLIPSR